MAITNMELNLKDKIFYCSYGYNMTIPQFCKIVRDNGKTVMAIMLKKRFIEGSQTSETGTVTATDEKVGIAFRLKKKQFSNEEVYLKGKFPEHNAAEVWFEWDGTPEFENHMD